MREATWLAALALACGAVAAALFWRALGPRTALLYGTDTVAHDYITLLYGWQELAGQRAIPLWCPYLFGGIPFIGAFAFCPFYPTQVLFALQPFNTAFTMQYVLAVALGAWTSAVWARSLRLGRPAALFAALLFAFSGHFLTLVYAGHLQKMMAIAWAPLVLAMAPRWSAGGPRGLRAALVGGFGLAMQLLASHTQIAYATAGAACVLAVVSMRRADADAPSPARQLGALARNGALVAIFALALSAAQTLPGIEMAAVSNRAGGVSFAEAVETSYPPRELWEFVLARVFGDSVRGSATPYFGFWGERIVSDYLGAWAVLLALIGLAAPARRLRWMLAALAGGSLVVGLGRYTPVYRWLHDWMPGFAKFRSPGTFMFVATAALVQLAAMGADWLLVELRAGEGPQSPLARGRARWRLWWPIAIALSAAVGGIFALAAPARAGALLGIGSTEQWQEHGAGLAHSVRIGGIQLFAGGLVLLLVMLGALGRRSRGQDSLRAGEGGGSPVRHACVWHGAWLALCAGALLLPLTANRHFIQFVPLDDYLRYLARYAADPFSRLGAPAPPRRTVPPNLLDNTVLLARVGSVAGYHPVFLGRYAALVEALGWYHPAFLRAYAVARVWAPPSIKLPSVEWRPAGPAGASVAQWVARRDPPYVWASGTPAIYTSRAEVLAAVAAQSDAHAARGDADRTGLAGVTLPQLDANWWAAPAGHVAAIEAVDAWRAGIAPAILFAEDRNAADGAAPRTGAPRDPRLSTLHALCGVAPVDVSVTSYRPGRIELRQAGGAARLFVVAENYAPGWKATDETGARLSVLAVNHAQLGVAAAQAHGRIVLAYAPASWRLGAFLSLAALAVAIMAAAPMRAGRGVLGAATKAGQRPAAAPTVEPCRRS
jgi:hypothetical protein